MEGLSYGTQTAGMPCFGQFNGDSVNERVLGMVGSCSSSEWMFRICLTSLLKVVLAEMRVGMCYGKFLTL